MYRYLSSHGWRPFKFRGGSGYGRGIFSQPLESSKSKEDKSLWSKSFQEKQAVIEKEFEEFKKMVDADPYRMLFGWTTPCSEPRSTGQGEKENPNHNEDMSAVKGRQHDDNRASTARPVNKGQVQEHVSQPSPPSPDVKAASRQETEIEEYEYDPITMRKVPKRPAHPASAPMHKKMEPDGTIIIPLNPFMLTDSPRLKIFTQPQALPRNGGLKPRQVFRNWLAQEGLGATGPRPETLGSSPQQQSEHIRSKCSNIETALDRLLRTERTQAEESSTNYPPSKFKDKENTPEDIDLLRASDVKASAGLRNSSPKDTDKEKHERQKTFVHGVGAFYGGPDGHFKFVDVKDTIEDIDLLRASEIKASAGLSDRSPKDTDKEKQERRKTLEKDFGRRQQCLDARLRDEVASRKAQAARSSSHEKPLLILSHMGSIKNSDCEPTRGNVGSEPRSEQVAESLRHEAINQKKIAAKSVHEEEVKAQKVAMEALEMRSGSAEKPGKVSPVRSQESGEGDMASNVYEFVDRSRWYKQRAPHAMNESELKFQQMAKDRALVREIRSIYEDEYGTIDTQHRQPSRPTDREGKEHTPAIGQSFKRPSGQLEQKDKKQHEQVVKHGSIRYTSPRALPDSLPRPSPHAQKPHLSLERLSHQTCNSQKTHKFDTSDILSPPLAKQVEQEGNEHTQEAVNQSKKLPTRALSDISDAPLRPNNSPKIQHAENRELERPRGSRAIPESRLRDGVISSASTDNGTGALSSDDSGISSASTPISSEGSDSTKPSSYRILAYDPSTQRVTGAKTTSMTAPGDEKSLTLVEALSRLATPAKFLPHFASLQNSGYEIVSGSTNILIFKKVRPGKPASHVAEESSSATIDDKYPRHINPIDGTTTQTGNFASPTGFVNHDAILPPSEDGQPMTSYPWSTKPNDKISRQEEVFSGSRPRWEDHRAEHMSKRLRNRQRRAERRRKTLKRMFWVGVWVAGCCYAVGVGTEFLRA